MVDAYGEASFWMFPQISELFLNFFTIQNYISVSCIFVTFSGVSYQNSPADIYLLKVNNRKTRAR